MTAPGRGMRPFGALLPLSEALERGEGAARPIERTETISVPEGLGRVLARNVVSGLDVPDFDRAAVDGFAMRATDLADGTATLDCAGRLFTGESPSEPVAPGTCIEIATGAILPEGADAVAMVETTERDGDAVRFTDPVRPGQHITRRGADIRSGETVLEAGAVLRPAKLGILTGIGLGKIEVHVRPRVAIYTTGDEIVEPGESRGPGGLFNMNGYTLEALVREHGGLPERNGVLPDDPDVLRRALESNRDRELILLSGGSSVGVRDLVADAVSLLGEVLYHGVAIKPGKPTLLGRVGSALVFGMPGYPTSCLTVAWRIVVPVLRKIARLPAAFTRGESVPLGEPVRSPAGKTHLLPVAIRDGKAWSVFKESGTLTSLSRADAFAEIPADVTALDAGDTVEVRFF